VWQRSALLEANYVRLSEQTVGVTAPVEAVYDLLNDPQEPKAILIIKIDVLSSVPSTSHVVNGTCILNTKRTSHVEESSTMNVDLQDLTLLVPG
jgi:hypothetical protein